MSSLEVIRYLNAPGGVIGFQKMILAIFWFKGLWIGNKEPQPGPDGIGQSMFFCKCTCIPVACFPEWMGKGPAFHCFIWSWYYRMFHYVHGRS